MDRKQLALGMVAVSEYFARQREQAEDFWLLASKVLAKSLKKEWLAYLDAYGMDEVEEDFIEQYNRRVLGARWTEAAFLAWVQEEVEGKRPLVTWIKAR